jgi:hypothetical protein
MQPGFQVATYHFCDARDARSCDPVTIVRTLAFRLAGSLRSYRRELLGMAKGEGLLSAWTCATPLAAFDRLLVEPLSRVPPPPNKWVVAVLDGIDANSFDSNPMLQVNEAPS